MKKLLPILFVILSFVSCKTCEPITVIRDSIHVEKQYHLDSIYLYAQDSIYVKEKGDTIYIDKWHLRYRDRLVEIHDTISVASEHTNTVVQYRMIRGQKFFFWFGIVTLLIVCSIIALKILKRFYLR